MGAFVGAVVVGADTVGERTIIGAVGAGAGTGTGVADDITTSVMVVPSFGC